jgi:hypothetical protein
MCAAEQIKNSSLHFCSLSSNHGCQKACMLRSQWRTGRLIDAHITDNNIAMQRYLVVDKVTEVAVSINVLPGWFDPLREIIPDSSSTFKGKKVENLSGLLIVQRCQMTRFYGIGARNLGKMSKTFCIACG